VIFLFNLYELKLKYDILMNKEFAMDIKTRDYKNSDYQFIYDVKKEVYQKYVELNWGEWNEEKQQKFFDEFINVYKDDIKIIVFDGIDIGFYHCKQIDQDNFEIVNICIRKEYQGKGIGSKILKSIIKDHKNQNIVLQCFKQNPVVNLYLRLGFGHSLIIIEES